MGFPDRGLPFDIKSFEQVASALLDRPLHLYGDVNTQHEYHWPYLPGYFPWVLARPGGPGAAADGALPA